MKILLVCRVGTPSSMLVDRIKLAAEQKNMEIVIEAHSVSEVKNLKNKFDVCFLAPEVRSSISMISKILHPIPVTSIDIHTYGLLNGSKVLKQAVELIEVVK